MDVHVVETNLFGMMHLANSFKRHLAASRGSFKAGVAQLTKSLAIAFAPSASA